MKQFAQQAFDALKPALTGSTRSFRSHFFTILLLVAVIPATAQQAVTGIITDYNGYWETRTGALNPVLPVNDHNLLSFTYNNTLFSTGINDALLASKGKTFVPGDFWALPVASLPGAPTSNTKIGVGQMYDGVHNGAGTVPSNDMSMYLTDGIKGLNIGTCVANIPSGNMAFFVNNIRPENIGDGIPDILVTQVADPSGSFDRYSFLNAQGNVVGTTRDIVFTSIPGIGSWTADFWTANQNPMTLPSGFTNTSRSIRLWAADLSEFGITPANCASVSKFNIRLSGDSDVAFVGYNRSTFSMTAVLPLSLGDFAAKTKNGQNILNWNTISESNSAYFLVEKKSENGQFIIIDTIAAAGSSSMNLYYTSTDANPQAGTNYYRLKMVDRDGKFEYSRTISIATAGRPASMQVSIYPNPATTQVTVKLPSNEGTNLDIYTATGVLVTRVKLGNSNSLTIPVGSYRKGTYYMVWQGTETKLSQSFLVN